MSQAWRVVLAGSAVLTLFLAATVQFSDVIAGSLLLAGAALWVAAISIKPQGRECEEGDSNPHGLPH